MTYLSIIKTASMAAMVGLMTACASTTPAPAPTSKADPFENINRSTFAFNNKFDAAILKPVAQVYADDTPSFIQTGVGNFFGNFNDVWTGVNSFLQGNVQDGFTDFMRVGVNTTIGFLGLLDVASEANIPKHRNDLGQTLGVWGLPNGPYLVLPFFGPSVVREAVALPIDFYGDAFGFVFPVAFRNSGQVVRVVDKRAGYLGSLSLLQDASLDEYIFVRDSFLQRIAGQITERKNFKQTRADQEEMLRQNDEIDAKPAAAATPAAPAASTAPSAPVTP